MSRVVGYIRVSSELQVDNYSLGHQRRSIEQHCSYHGHDLLCIYADEGRSAYADDLKKRPAFCEAIEAVTSGEADAIVVDKLDRLARNARVFHDVMYRIKNRAIFIKEGIDPTTHTGELVAGILAQSAQFFSRNLGSETRKGKQERVAAGLWLGELPYGYRKQEGDDRGKQAPVFDEDIIHVTSDGQRWSRASSVQYIFDQAAAGVTRRQIVHDMREMGLQEINRGLVNSILKSRFYIGELPVRRNNTAEGAEEWVPGIQPRLVNRDVFDATRRAASENRKGAAVVRKSIDSYSFSGLARCGRCGSSMHCYQQHGVIRLFCSARHSSGLCDQVSVKAERIEESVLGALRAYAPPEDIARRIAEVLEGGRRDTDSEQRVVEDQQRKLRDLYITYGHMSKKEYVERNAALEQKLERLQADATPSEGVEELAAMIHDLPSVYMEAKPAQRNRLLGRVFRELLVDNQELIAVRVKPGIDAMLRTRRHLLSLDLADACSWRYRAGRRRMRW